MNREQYLKELRKYLKRLPKEDYENAMEYFTEYFDDVKNDDKAIRELGSPREAASELLAALLDQKARDPFANAEFSEQSINNQPGRRYRMGDSIAEPKSKNSPLSILLIVCLSILAAPIAAPLALAAFVLLLMGVIIVFVAVFCVFVFSVSLAIIGVFSLIKGIAFATASVPGFLVIFGGSLLSVGLGVLLFIAGIFFCKWLILALAKLIQRMLHKRRVKTDE